MRDQDGDCAVERQTETAATLDLLDTLHKEAIEAHEAAHRIHDTLFAEPTDQNEKLTGEAKPAGFFGRVNAEGQATISRLREVNALLRQIADRL